MVGQFSMLTTLAMLVGQTTFCLLFNRTILVSNAPVVPAPYTVQIFTDISSLLAKAA